MAEKLVSFDSADALLSVFGSYDENIRLLEKEFNVQILSRDTELKISGEPDHINQACRTLEALLKWQKAARVSPIRQSGI